MIRTCRRIQKRIPAFLDAEVTPKMRSAVSRHLDVCPDCRRLLAATSQSWELLAEIEEITPRNDFDPLFWEKAREFSSPRVSRTDRLWARFPIPAIAAAGFVLGIAGGFFLGKAAFFDKRAPTTQAARPPTNGIFPYLDTFADFPGDSVGGAYIAVATQSGGAARRGGDK
jgi:anti-sigma factor RsiW